MLCLVLLNDAFAEPMDFTWSVWKVNGRLRIGHGVSGGTCVVGGPKVLVSCIAGRVTIPGR